MNKKIILFSLLSLLSFFVFASETSNRSFTADARSMPAPIEQKAIDQDSLHTKYYWSVAVSDTIKRIRGMLPARFSKMPVEQQITAVMQLVKGELGLSYDVSLLKDSTARRNASNVDVVFSKRASIGKRPTLCLPLRFAFWATMRNAQGLLEVGAEHGGNYVKISNNKIIFVDGSSPDGGFYMTEAFDTSDLFTLSDDGWYTLKDGAKIPWYFMTLGGEKKLLTDVGLNIMSKLYYKIRSNPARTYNINEIFKNYNQRNNAFLAQFEQGSKQLAAGNNNKQALADFQTALSLVQDLKTYFINDTLLFFVALDANGTLQILNNNINACKSNIKLAQKRLGMEPPGIEPPEDLASKAAAIIADKEGYKLSESSDDVVENTNLFNNIVDKYNVLLPVGIDTFTAGNYEYATIIFNTIISILDQNPLSVQTPKLQDRLEKMRKVANNNLRLLRSNINFQKIDQFYSQAEAAYEKKEFERGVLHLNNALLICDEVRKDDFSSYEKVNLSETEKKIEALLKEIDQSMKSAVNVKNDTTSNSSMSKNVKADVEIGGDAEVGLYNSSVKEFNALKNDGIEKLKMGSYEDAEEVFKKAIDMLSQNSSKIEKPDLKSNFEKMKTVANNGLRAVLVGKKLQRFNELFKLGSDSYETEDYIKATQVWKDALRLSDETKQLDSIFWKNRMGEKAELIKESLKEIE
jgi:tetratricopeptide (TPR) repeat protein